MRSVMLSALRYWAKARAIASSRLGHGQEIEADILERAASGARPRPAGRGPARSCADRSRRARRRGARRSPRAICRRAREDRVGIDIGADLAGDVGFARRRQLSATNAGSSVGSSRIAPSAAIRPSSSRAGAPARSAATLPLSKVIASVCTACQRLNGSQSWAARKRRSSAIDRQRKLDRRGEAAVERRDRPLGDAGEDEALARLGQFDARRASSGCRRA